MSTWTAADLAAIDGGNEIRIATERKDGTLRDQVIVWVVRVGDDLYVRAVRGRTSPWFRGVLSRHSGTVAAGGRRWDVEFVEVGDDLQAQIDAAYRRKYARYAASIVNSTVTPDAIAATLRLVPR
jgi:hypothetical protein